MPSRSTVTSDLCGKTSLTKKAAGERGISAQQTNE
ncbi:hypothetical protein PRBEI_2000204200 [Prionailurus iriomotensis]